MKGCNWDDDGLVQDQNEDFTLQDAILALQMIGEPEDAILESKKVAEAIFEGDFVAI